MIENLRGIEKHKRKISRNNFQVCGSQKLLLMLMIILIVRIFHYVKMYQFLTYILYVHIHTYINIHQVVLPFYDLSSVLIQNWLPFPQCHPDRAPLSMALLHEVVSALPSSALLTLTTASFCSAQGSSLSVVPPAGLLPRLSICCLNQWRPPGPLSLAHQYGW